MSRSRDVKMGENARTRSFFSPRARVLLYFYCFDGSAAREYVCLFFAKWVGKKKRKSSRLLMKNESLSKQKLNQNLCSGWKKKKRRQPKSKFLFSSSRFFLEWVSLDENFFFFFSFLLILCARWHFFTNLLSYHSNAPKTFTHRSWYMHTRALTKYHPHKPALTCIFSSFLIKTESEHIGEESEHEGVFFLNLNFTP